MSLHFLESAFYLLPLGICVGTFGTIMGIGGGFILIPVFFFLYPDRPAAELTAVSLAVVFFNSLSGTIAHARKKRVHFRSGLYFAAAAIPGAVLGAITTAHIPRAVFDPLFAVFLILVGIYLFRKPIGKNPAQGGKKAASAQVTAKSVHLKPEALRLGTGISVGVGYLSSVLGLGGGIIHVPALVHLLKFPVHVATATSQFILVILTLVGCLVHFARGALQEGLPLVWILAPSVVIGAQFGAWLSPRLRDQWIIRLLALTIIFVGLRLMVARFSGGA